jgi:hypothetical protein
MELRYSVGATHIDNLQPNASVEGRLWYYGFQGSVQPKLLVVTYEEQSPTVTIKKYNPATGSVETVPATRTVARAEHVYIAAEDSQLDTALIAALNINPEYDKEGRLIGASSVDRSGVLRAFRITLLGKTEQWEQANSLSPYQQKLTLSGILTYSEQRLDGRAHSYDQVDYGIPDTTTFGRLFSAAVTMVFDSSGSTLMDLVCQVVGFPKGSEIKNGIPPVVNVLSYGGSVDPAWNDRGVLVAVPLMHLKRIVEQHGN